MRAAASRRSGYGHTRFHHTLKPAAQQSTPGGLLWTLRKGTDTESAEPRTIQGDVGRHSSRNGE